MLSPTNYHIPTEIAKDLAYYHRNDLTLEESVNSRDILAITGVLDEITDPDKNIAFGIGCVAGHEMFMIDDHDRPAHNASVDR